MQYAVEISSDGLSRLNRVKFLSQNLADLLRGRVTDAADGRQVLNSLHGCDGSEFGILQSFDVSRVNAELEQLCDLIIRPKLVHVAVTFIVVVIDNL